MRDRIPRLITSSEFFAARSIRTESIRRTDPMLPVSKSAEMVTCAATFPQTPGSATANRTIFIHNAFINENL